MLSGALHRERNDFGGFACVEQPNTRLEEPARVRPARPVAHRPLAAVALDQHSISFEPDARHLADVCNSVPHSTFPVQESRRDECCGAGLAYVNKTNGKNARSRSDFSTNGICAPQRNAVLP